LRYSKVFSKKEKGIVKVSFYLARKRFIQGNGNARLTMHGQKIKSITKLSTSQWENRKVSRVQVQLTNSQKPSLSLAVQQHAIRQIHVLFLN
jgi:hypothetical protein